MYLIRSTADAPKGRTIQTRGCTPSPLGKKQDAVRVNEDNVRHVTDSSSCLVTLMTVGCPARAACTHVDGEDLSRKHSQNGAAIGSAATATATQ
jgi:hypothetical protein